jgi:hypothetical protein
MRARLMRALSGKRRAQLTFHVDVTIVYMCMATVARKSIPIMSAAVFSFLESISNVADPSYAETSAR